MKELCIGTISPEGLCGCAVKITAAVVACLLVGCSSVPLRFQNAQEFVVVEHDAPDADRVAFSTGGTLVAECEHLFPAYKTIPRGDSGPCWATKYDIFVCFDGGRAVRITSDGNVWTMGRGYLPINGDLRAFFRKARAPRRGEVAP